ncbi:MAG: glycosyltransferase family 2 protein [Bacillales bacterium]|nr:glycosyltransferase family 2 protein [Bacillales bacterium]
MEIKVSVIIPAYNTEEYIAECMESIINQTLKEIEIIVVDDGSTDRTWDMLQEYELKYPDKIRAFHKENGGQASARNFALQYARGEYLGFVDSDDWIDAEMYDEMYQKAETEKADIVICDMVDHFPNHEIYHHASQFEDKFTVTPSACNKIFKRSFAEDVCFPEGLWYEDFEYTTKQLMKTEKISVIHKGFYHCHCREVSTMRNDNSTKNKDILKVVENLELFAKENGWQEKYADAIEYLYIDHILLTTINRLEIQKNRKKREVIQYLRRAVCKKYPCFYKSAAFQKLNGNRRLIAWLNAKGLSTVSKMLFDIKAKL